MKISVIGAGGWGTALAIQAAKKNDVILWSHNEKETKLFIEKRENVYYLPGIKIPETIEISGDIEKAAQSEILLFAPPSKFFRNVVSLFKKYIDGTKGTKGTKESKILVSATKGFEYPSELRMSETLEDVLKDKAHGEITVLSGPTHAEEVSKNVPSSMVAASKNEDAAKVVQQALANESLRIYTNNDVIGVEVCGAVKNVIAIAAGMLRGLGFGDNTMAALITRGLAEIRRLGLRLGAKESTFSGLAGMGDLIVTCISRHSRNGRVGEALGKGQNIDEILSSTKMVAEGVETVKSIMKFEKELGISMPISHAVYEVIYDGLNSMDALKTLMSRPLKNEYI